MKKIKIAMIQMKVQFGCLETNLQHAASLVASAADSDIDICVMPECLDLGWGNPDARTLAHSIPGKVSDFYCKIARENQVYLVAGLTEKEEDKVYNSALLISDKGEILHKHRKINVLSDVESIYSKGTLLKVTDTPFGKIAINICADNLMPSIHIGHTLGNMGAQLLLSPCAWAVAPDRDPIKEPYGMEWHVPYKELSSTHHMAIVGVSNVGPLEAGDWKDAIAIGNSIAYDSNGEIAAVLPFGVDAECVHIVEIAF